MRFYCDNTSMRRRSIPGVVRGAQYPCVVLEKDNWDDYDHKTSFRASIYRNSKDRVHQGVVKILRTGHNITSLPTSFDSLSEEFCSLWQDLEDYKAINSLAFGKDIFDGLNDVNYNEIIRDKFRYQSGFGNSLLRFSDAERAFQEGQKLLQDNMEDVSNFSFYYTEGPDSQTPFGTIPFKFSRKLLGMHRTIGVIGRNGVGKTTLLANLATVLSGIKKSEAKLSPRPPFSKVIAVSYSTFDEFYRPRKDERTFSYSYCGIRGEKDLLTRREIEELFRSSYRSIEKSGRVELWEECMEILYLNKLENYFPSEQGILESYKKLS